MLLMPRPGRASSACRESSDDAHDCTRYPRRHRQRPDIGRRDLPGVAGSHRADQSALNAFNYVVAERAIARATLIDEQRAAGATLGPWPACRSLSRTTCASRVCARPHHRRSSIRSIRRTARRSWTSWNRPGRSSSARPTATSSRWDRRTRTPRTDPVSTRGPPIAHRADRAAARRQRSRRSASHWHWARIPADRSGSRRRSAAWSGQTHLRASLAIWTAGFRLVARSDRPIHALGQRRGARAFGAVRTRRDGFDLFARIVPDFAAALTGDIRGVRVGVPQAFVTDGVDDMVRRAFNGALDVLRDRGATLVDVELPHAAMRSRSTT